MLIGDYMLKDGYKIRSAQLSDHLLLKRLYQQVARVPGGIAREYDEIDDAYIDTMLTSSLKNGIILVAMLDDKIIGSISTYKLQPRCFSHMLAGLTIGVDPSHQARGVGRSLFVELLSIVKCDWPTIARVELMVRESNAKAIIFYESLGFKKEGYLEKRVMGVAGILESDISMGWMNPEYKQ
jgi:ribosomal protein S18 acetylase RimI-like enzyme